MTDQTILPRERVEPFHQIVKLTSFVNHMHRRARSTIKPFQAKPTGCFIIDTFHSMIARYDLGYHFNGITLLDGNDIEKFAETTLENFNNKECPNFLDLTNSKTSLVYPFAKGDFYYSGTSRLCTIYAYNQTLRQTLNYTLAEIEDGSAKCFLVRDDSWPKTSFVEFLEFIK